MKKLTNLILLFLVTGLLHSQDIIYTVSCEKDSVDTKLDSIKFENLSNDSHIVFGSLPDQSSYLVNLTLQQIEGNTGIEDFPDADKLFRIIKNIPGEICIQRKFDIPEIIKLSVVDLKGQKLLNQIIGASNPSNTITIHIPNSGIYILNLHSSLGSQSFKVLGSGRSGTISYSTNIDNQEKNAMSLKSALSENESDFNFQQGDSLKITAFLDGNSTYPIIFQVNESDSLDLFFVDEDENYFIVDNVKYSLNLGHHVWGNAADCGYGNDGSNVFLHGLYLTTDITYGFYEGFQGYIPFGKGNILIFNMLNRDSVLVSGEYRFIDHVDCYGIVTDGDSTYQMTDNEKFVRRKPHVDRTCYAIEVDMEVDWDNVDPDNPSDEVLEKWGNYINAGVEITEGLVTIEKNEETFIITIDCIDSNGLKIIGRYSGELKWILFDV